MKLSTYTKTLKQYLKAESTRFVRKSENLRKRKI
jgi:hypothetical protein